MRPPWPLMASLVSYFLVSAARLPLVDAMIGRTEHCWGLRTDCSSMWDPCTKAGVPAAILDQEVTLTLKPYGKNEARQS